MAFITYMKIQPHTPIDKTQTFKARNKEIRYADKIMRNLMQEYPAFSSSRVKYYNVVNKNQKLIMKIMPHYWKLHAKRCELTKYKNTALLNETLKMVKEEKNANCAELSKMAKAAFLANGFKDVRIASLRLHFPERFPFVPSLVSSKKIDHDILIVNAGKNAKLEKPETLSKHAYIVDPWSGFCDYVSNGLNRYKGIFFRDLKPKEHNTKKKFIFKEIYEMKTTSATCKTMALHHPELIVKNKPAS